MSQSLAFWTLLSSHLIHSFFQFSLFLDILCPPWRKSAAPRATISDTRTPSEALGGQTRRATPVPWMLSESRLAKLRTGWIHWQTRSSRTFSRPLCLRLPQSQTADTVSFFAAIRYLPAIGRFLIVVTFIEDSLRIITQLTDQLMYLRDFRSSMFSFPLSRPVLRVVRFWLTWSCW